jgi:hypothetical protein
MVRAVGRSAATFSGPTKHEPQISSTNNLFQVRRFIRSDRISSNAHATSLMSCMVAGKKLIQAIQHGRQEFAPRSVHLHAHDLQSFLVCTQLAAGTVFDPLVAWPSATSEVVFATTDFLAGEPPSKLGIETSVSITSRGEQLTFVSISAYPGRQNQRHPIIQSPDAISRPYPRTRPLATRARLYANSLHETLPQKSSILSLTSCQRWLSASSFTFRPKAAARPYVRISLPRLLAY